LRLRCPKALIVFTGIKRYSDKYILQSIKKGFIRVSLEENLIENGTLFVFDDVSSLGICYPNDLISLLEQNNSPLVLLKGIELAKNVVPLLEPRFLSVLEGGGILSYLFLKQAGYQGELFNKIEVLRNYINERPVCKLANTPLEIPSLILDDIVASGQTLRTVLDNYECKSTDMACLLASTNVPKGVEGYRVRDKSTFSQINTLYAGKLVNGLMNEDCSNKKPTILSLRYLLTKASDNGDYTKEYLAKKFGGIKRAEEIGALVKKVDREPLDLLRINSIEFLKMYGVK